MAMTIVGDLPPGMVGDRYEAWLSAASGNPPYQWATTDYTSLPPGLQLDQQGRITGVPEPAAEGTNTFSLQVTDASAATARRDFSLIINPALRISRSIELGQDADPPYLAGFSASGGAPPYTWELARGSRLPDGLILDPGTGQIKGAPWGTGTTRFRVQVCDRVGHADGEDFALTVSPPSLVRHPVARLRGDTIDGVKIDRLRVKVSVRRRLHPFSRFSHITNWLGFLALALPAFGAIWIGIYAFTGSGEHLSYLGVGMLAALAAFLSGCLIGFLFGIPRVVSSGQFRHDKGLSAYSPSSNLAEVSDWLTKLLLGAGLVQLTRLGGPVGGLIDSVAGGLHAAAAGGTPSPSARVMAGAILIGYSVIGLLDGYVVTIFWYQKKIANL